MAAYCICVYPLVADRNIIANDEVKHCSGVGWRGMGGGGCCDPCDLP